MLPRMYFSFSFFFFNDTATTEIYTLSLHDALPICKALGGAALVMTEMVCVSREGRITPGCAGLYKPEDRKSTRLNSSHTVISYAVFCLKKKKNRERRQQGLQRRHNEILGVPLRNPE